MGKNKKIDWTIIGCQNFKKILKFWSVTELDRDFKPMSGPRTNNNNFYYFYLIFI